MTATINKQEQQPLPLLAYHVLRYAPNLIRDEWINIGVLLFNPYTGERRLRVIEAQEEFARLRRLHPQADEEALRQLRDHLDDRLAASLLTARSAAEGGEAPLGEVLEEALDKMNASLSNAIQLAPRKGVHSADLDHEMDRLYEAQVAPIRPDFHVGSPGSRATMRNYCAQVWKQGGLWQKIQKSVRVAEFTFPGDPMRIDYAYRRNGTRGFVNTLSVSRSPRDCKEYAYTAKKIAVRIRSEFMAVTDIQLNQENERQKFVLDTLTDAGIVAVPLNHFATWVPKLKPSLQ